MEYRSGRYMVWYKFMMFDISIDSYSYYRMYTVIICSDPPSLDRLNRSIEGVNVVSTLMGSDGYEFYLAGKFAPEGLVPIVGDSILDTFHYRFIYERVWIV